MLRISKLTDYAIVLLTYYVSSDDCTLTARELAELSELPRPTVGKILKALCKAELLVSLRGVKGGYQLARPANRITVAEIIAAIEGPVALTECSIVSEGACDLEGSCPVRSNWRVISQVVGKALESISLKEMSEPSTKSCEEAKLVLLRR